MDTEKLLQFLNARNVRYVVIGATAFPVHGYARATLDVDILIDATRENAGRTRDALGDFGYDIVDLSVEDLLTKKVLIREYVLQTDIHPFVAGVTFGEVWKNHVESRLGETPAAFASLCRSPQGPRGPTGAAETQGTPVRLVPITAPRRR